MGHFLGNLIISTGNCWGGKGFNNDLVFRLKIFPLTLDLSLLGSQHFSKTFGVILYYYT